MGNNTCSRQPHSMSPFSRDAHDDETPLFLRTEPNDIKTVKEASKSFMSLVNFVKEGRNMDEQASRQACALLDRMMPEFFTEFTRAQILFEFVPTRDHSCSGFVKSITLLLTSSNEELVKKSLVLVYEIMSVSDEMMHFDILASGLFALLPKSFYEHEMHLLAQPTMHLMQILWLGVMCSNTTYKNLICRYKHVSERSFKRIFLTKFFNPIQPFLEYICRNRRRIEDSRTSWHFPSLIGKIVESSRDMEETTQFVLSSSIALACTDCPTFFETDSLTVTLLEYIRSARRQIGYCRPADRWRPLQILAKLRDDGISDVVELHMRCSGYDSVKSCRVFLGAQLIHELGGDVPFL
ncbi:hypothetical protein BLNAU_6180 [Blattamonas nauphoetae]|uniref:Uncharacterized protein n=1 Tax=Blattamonas nauphoetae TaxID=2049346 RepID=A0ABQ9Y5B4_9EUKA|nr:hypothetical protein BLNAU_6180 [Blattamonas nauphoetae]